jgi:glycosyltransferase involved in cell wall biosynthesis
MRIINIVMSTSPIFTGMWQAAMSTAAYFKLEGIESEIWSPDADEMETPQYLLPYTKRSVAKLYESNIETLIQKAQLNPANDLIVTHGCWYEPTRIGYALKKRGYRWVAIPHGVLDEWAMQQKWLKKRLYFTFFEKRALKQADILRGVSPIETKRIKSFFPNKEVVCIPNGVKTDGVLSFDTKATGVMRFVFLGRLHHKKGVLLLVEAWNESNLQNNPRFSLDIIGPDEGELEKMQPYLNQSDNIVYHGAIFDAEKKANILRGGHFFILPSFSEGFPSSVVEAMFHGAIPVITKECNFPEIFDNNLGFEIKPNRGSIKTQLNELSKLDLNSWQSRFREVSEFVKAEYGLDKIAQAQLAVFKQLFERKN